MKKLILAGLLCAAPLFAQVPVISRGATFLEATQSAPVTCTANCTGLTWQVNGITGGNSTVGTISGSGSTATYTAPASVVANNSWGGCPTGFNDALWNTPVAGMPMIANWKGNPYLNSAWYISYNLLNDGHKSSMAGAPPTMSDTFGISYADSTSPLITASGITNIPWPQTPSRFRETGVYNWNWTDQHVNIIDTDACRIWEEYSDNNNTVTCAAGQNPPCYSASSAAQLPRNSYVRIGGTDAAGNMISPYLLHLSEVKSGVVKHAVHLNLPQGLDSNQTNLMWPATWGTGFCSGNMVVGLSGFPTGSGYSAATTITFSGGGGDGTETWSPVITGGVITGANMKHSAVNSSFTSPPTVVITDTGGGTGAALTATIGTPCIPYGARLALDQTYLAQHAGAGCSAGSNCITGAGLVVATALANYGGVILDNQGGGSGWVFDAADDFRQDPATINSIFSALSHLTIDHWHVYDTTGLGNDTANGGHTNLSTGCNDNTGNEPCVSQQVLPGNNLNYLPPGADWITATNASGASFPVTIPLTPSTIGTTDTVLWMLAGDYSGSKGTGGGYQIPYWVHGNPNLAVRWSLQASPNGSITPGGIYTPPATVTTTGLQDVATCTLNADPNVTAQVYINLLPNSGNYVANTIRVDTGNSSNYGPDGNGNYWLGNVGMYSGSVSVQSSNWPYYVGTGEKTVYDTSIFAYNDITYTFIVPNGDYRVRFMSGWDQAFWGALAISNPQWNHMPLMVWSNDNGYTGKSGGSGGIKGLFWNMMEGAAYPYATNSNSDFIFGTKVVDNRLTAGLGSGNPNTGPIGSSVGFPACVNVNNSCATLPEMSGLDIEPDSTSPYWTIGVTNAVTPSNAAPFVTSKPVVVSGGKVALYVQDWYTGLTDPITGMTDPVWSIVSGPGTLSSEIPTKLTPNLQFPLEVYTAPSTQPGANTGVIIKATSQSNPSISATIALTITGNQTTPAFFK